MARSFASASTQYLSRASAVVTATPFSMACWYRVTTVSGSRSLLSLGNSATTNRWHNLRLTTSGGNMTLRAGTRVGASEVSAAATATHNDSIWHQATGVWTSTASRTIYLDGGNSATETTDLNPVVDLTNIATRVSGGTPGELLDGEIAEAAIWNVALTADEALSLSKGFSPLLIRPTALVETWRLIGRNDPETGWKGNDLTLVNTPTVAPHPRILMPRRRTLVSFGAGVAPPAGSPNKLWGKMQSSKLLGKVA